MSAAGCANRLRRALERSADAAGLDLTIEQAEAVGWASATFVGARHEVRFSVAASEVGDAWIADLPEAELTLPGHLVADLRIVSVTRDAGAANATIEVLTVVAS